MDDDNNNVTPLVCYHYLLIGATIKRQVLGHAKKLLTTSTVISTTVALDYDNTSFVTHEERDGKKNFFVFRWFLSSDTRTQRCSAAREKSSAVAAATLLCRFHLPRGLPSLGFFSAAALSILVAPRSFGRATERFRKLRASPTIIIPLSWHFLSWKKKSLWLDGPSDILFSFFSNPSRCAARNHLVELERRRMNMDAQREQYVSRIHLHKLKWIGRVSKHQRELKEVEKKMKYKHEW